MRTTVTLAGDVAAAVEERMRDGDVGRSEAVNAADSEFARFGEVTWLNPLLT